MAMTLTSSGNPWARAIAPVLEAVEEQQCTVQPYSPSTGPQSLSAIEAIQIKPAVLEKDWGPCPAPALRLEHALPGAARHEAGIENIVCRKYKVPLDHAGVDSGSLSLTVARGFQSEGPNQLWVMQGGPGGPSHPLL